MKPLKLTLNAFGPYVAKQEIDFTQAADDGIFLVTGETGAGKTTIFDGISFALFGSASGDSRKPNTFKSDHAPISEVCWVELSFLLRDKTYFVRRSPAQRGEKRGGGLKDIAPTAELIMPDSEVITGASAVTACIEQILGLNYRQFKQTTMLAQGEFQQLIEASGAQKQEIFSKIFGTSVYTAFTERLLREETALQHKAQSAQDAIGRCVHALAGYGHTALADPNAHLWPFARIQELVEEAVASYTAQSQQFDAEIAQLEQQKLEYNPEQARQINEKLAKRDALREILKQMDEAAEQIAQEEKALARLKYAAELAAQEQIITTVKTQAEECAQQNQSLQEKHQRLAERAAAAAGLLEQGGKLPEMLALTQKRDKQEQEYQELYRRLLSGQAALLADSLQAGQPCPVCGSQDHPAPAVSKRQPTTEQHVRDAQNALAALDKQIAQKLESMNKAHWEAKSACEKSAAQIETTAALGLKLQEQFSTLRADFIQKLKDYGFAGYKEYQAVLQNRERASELAQKIGQYHQRKATATAQLAALEEDTAGKTITDVQAIVAAGDSIAKQLAALREHKTEVYALLSGSQKRLDELRQLSAEYDAVSGRYAVAHELAALAKGSRTVSFERYILASYFDDIIGQANIHLQLMTGSRYRLRRREDASIGSGSGLDMEIIDSYTGKQRDISTLSGGESFKASLALALGLSTVVQIYAGGISIDTMFIDEGFGSLDERSLDSAVETLITLKKNGRMVGVISHVQQLRSYIPRKLAVRYASTGSTVQWL